MDVRSVLRTKIKSPIKSRSSKKFFQQAYGLGFLGAIGILTISFTIPALLAISIAIESAINPPENSFADSIPMFILFIITILSYELATFVPALWLGTKQGWKAGVKVIVYEAAWLIAILLITFIFSVA